MKTFVKTSLSLAALLLCVDVNAYQINGTITATINKTDQASLSSKTPHTKDVTLMNIFLTPREKELLAQYVPSPDDLTEDQSSLLPSKLDLGMNGVPILDQGKHGTCVTFAVTAAIDAVTGKGDYVSQLCNLELGNYLAQLGYAPSGWDGASSNLILTQISQYGIINKDNQLKGSCAGVTEYPLNQMDDHGNPMLLSDYKQFSENLDGQVITNPIFTLMDRFMWTAKHPHLPDMQDAYFLHQIKSTLASEEDGMKIRVVFGTFVDVNVCSAGACGSYHAPNDTWVLSSEIVKDPKPSLAGHEMVITGYDDNAVVVDSDGKKHRGLLILRNSWGDDVGDHGNFYMTYDYFKKYVMDSDWVAYSPNQGQGK